MTDAHIPPPKSAVADCGGVATSAGPDLTAGVEADVSGEDLYCPSPRARGGSANRSAAGNRKRAASAKAEDMTAGLSGAPAGSRSLLEQSDPEREKLFMHRLIELGDSAHRLARDNIGLAIHEPDEKLRDKLAAIGTRCAAVWVTLYEKEREVRSRLAGRG